MRSAFLNVNANIMWVHVCAHTQFHMEYDYFTIAQFLSTSNEIGLDIHAMSVISDDGGLHLGVLQTQRPHGFSWSGKWARLVQGPPGCHQDIRKLIDFPIFAFSHYP